MKAIHSSDEALSLLNQLIKQSNGSHEQLYSFFEKLAAENEQLKLTVHKLRLQTSAKPSNMHSKLTEALRE